jgi:predicted RNase H-like nuclease (RuvC/YqgF family)
MPKEDKPKEKETVVLRKVTTEEELESLKKDLERANVENERLTREYNNYEAHHNQMNENLEKFIEGDKVELEKRKNIADELMLK